MDKQVKPLGNRVLIEREKNPAMKGKILLPETAQEKPKLGKVIAVGIGSYDKEGNVIPLSLKVGDRVLFSTYAGTEVFPEDNERDYLVVSEEDVLAIIE